MNSTDSKTSKFGRKKTYTDKEILDIVKKLSQDQDLMETGTIHDQLKQKYPQIPRKTVVERLKQLEQKHKLKKRTTKGGPFLWRVVEDED